MKLILKQELDTKELSNGYDEVDIAGELLRDEFFVQDRYEGILGCYDTFTVKKNVLELQVICIEDVRWYHYYKKVNGYPVDMYYSWDGDGTLLFILDDCALYNGDCKKTISWEKYPKSFWESILNGNNPYN